VSPTPVPTRTLGDWLVVSPTGALDIATSPRIAVEVRELVWGGARSVCLDLGAVEFIDSSGLAALLNIQRALDRVDGRMTMVAAPGSQPCTALRVLNTHAALHVAASVEEAVAPARG